MASETASYIFVPLDTAALTYKISKPFHMWLSR